MSLLHHIQTALGPTGLPIRRVYGHESDHFTQSSAEVNNSWSCTSHTTLCALVVCTGKNLRPLDSISHAFHWAPRKPTICCYRTTSYRPYIGQLFSSGRLLYAYIHTYTYTFRGSISVSYRQQDVEQVMNTLVCHIPLFWSVAMHGNVGNHLFPQFFWENEFCNLYINLASISYI